MVFRMSLTGILALRIATLLTPQGLQQQHARRQKGHSTRDRCDVQGPALGDTLQRFNRDDVRIARATRSRARITLTSDIEAVA
jgi:hypothetical protein